MFGRTVQLWILYKHPLNSRNEQINLCYYNNMQIGINLMQTLNDQTLNLLKAIQENDKNKRRMKYSMNPKMGILWILVHVD